MLLSVLAVILLFVFIVALVIALTASPRQERISRRMEELQAKRPQVQAPLSAVSRQLQKPFTERILQPIWRGFTQRLLRLAPHGMIESVQRKLNAAGNPPGLTEPVFLLLRSLAMLLGAGLAIMFHTKMSAEAQPMLRVLGPLLVLVICSMAPDMLLNSRIQTRQAAIRKSLPDILDLLVVSVEAGMGLDGALAEVVRRKSGPLVDEFERALVEIRWGKRRRQAWMDMAERARVEELTALVAALYQAEEMGVSIAKALRAHADGLRAKRSLKIREKAAVLGTKMLFPLIFCIFPALFVIIMGPGILSMKNVFLTMGR